LPTSVVCPGATGDTPIVNEEQQRQEQEQRSGNGNGRAATASSAARGALARRLRLRKVWIHNAARSNATPSTRGRRAQDWSLRVLASERFWRVRGDFGSAHE